MAWQERYFGLVLLASAVGCSADPTAEGRFQPQVAPPAVREQSVAPNSIDDLFLRISNEDSHFAGVYIDGQGRTALNVTPGADAQRTLEVVRSVLGWVPGTGSPSIRTVKFSFAELVEAKSRLDSSLEEFLTAVEFTDIDEVENSYFVGTSTDAAAQLIVRRSVAMGLPEGIITAQRVPHSVRLTNPTLSSQVRPAIGGLSLVGGGHTCTLGLNVRPDNLSGEHFLTAAHCTQSIGAYDGGAWNQPLIVANSLLGYEVLDPPFVSGLGACTTGAYCRYSDAAMISYTSDTLASFGRIARTQFYATYWNHPGSNVIDTTAPFVAYADLPASRFVVGHLLNKMGQTTGWSVGRISHTCTYEGAGLDASSHSLFVLCGYRVSDDYDVGSDLSGPGDSGAPVFYYVTDDEDPPFVRMYPAGILFAGSPPVDTFPSFYVFSPLTGVRQDLGAFKTYSGPACTPNPYNLLCP